MTKLKLRFMKIVLIFIYENTKMDSQISRDAILLANDIKHKLKEE